MKKTSSILLGVLCCLGVTVTFGQLRDYSYKRPLKGVSAKWHKVVLPEDVYGKISKDLTDVRIYGITRTGDTVETPYLMRVSAKNQMHRDVSCTVSGKPKKDTGYIIAFENSTSARVNHLFVDLDPQIADRAITLEGSRDGTRWTVIEEECDVSSGTIGTELRSTMRLDFRPTTLRYLRLSTKDVLKPSPGTVRIAYADAADQVLRGLTVSNITRREDKESKCTELDVELPSPVPVGWIKIHVHGTSYYYRPVAITWAYDSIKSGKGWVYSYGTLFSGFLSSEAKQPFSFNSTIVKKFRIVIENQDSPPLRIDSIEVKGCIHELAATFEPDIDYILAYGKQDATRPEYDIERFSDNVPDSLNAVLIGQEQKIEKPKPFTVEPLFTNKAWFWLVMAAVVAVLGWFSIKMLRTSDR